MKYTGVNHLAMATGDLDKTIRFWRDLLGMRLVVSMGEKGYKHYFFELSGVDMIAFFEWEGVEPAPEKEHGRPVKGPYIFDHVSIGVESDEDLFMLRDRLNAADVWVSEVVDHGFVHSIYSFDPNGIPIEFSAPVPGMDVHKKPALMDPMATEVAREGSEPNKKAWPSAEAVRGPHGRDVYPGVGSEFFKGLKGTGTDR